MCHLTPSRFVALPSETETKKNYKRGDGKMKVEKIKEISSLIKTAELSGTILIGKIDGVDFTASGKLENGTSYGASVKLKFTSSIDSSKNVNGVSIPTKKLISQIIKIPTDDNSLPMMVAKYNGMIGKDVIIPLQVSDNSSFTTFDTNVFELVA
jgi:hypothetical protein